MINVKKLFCLIFIFVLSSCNNSKISNNQIELASKADVYAYNMNKGIIEMVDIIYEINDVVDVFNLYTKYQNNLPIGYTSMGTCNVSLIDYKIDDNICYYYVDKYISLVDDISIFSELLSNTNALLGYKDTKFLYNDNIIA